MLSQFLLAVLLFGAAYLPAQSVDTLLLSVDTTLEISALTVKAKPIEYGELATAELSQMDVYLDPAAKADPLLAVQALPAATTEAETANISLRGSIVGATGVYLNGVPLRSAVRIDQTNGLGQFSIFGQLPLEGITVYAAAPPVGFSQAAAGAVVVETAADRPERPLTSLSLHLAGGGASHRRTVGERGSLTAYANVGTLAPFRFLNGRRIEAVQRSRSVDGMLSYRHELGKGGSVQLTYLGFRESYKYEHTMEDGSPLNIEQEKDRHLAVVNYRQLLNKDWTLAVDYGGDYHRPDFRVGDDRYAFRRDAQYGATYVERRVTGSTLRVGVAANQYASETTPRQLYEPYAQAQFRLHPKLLAGGGTKLVHGTYDGTTRLTTQASLRYQLTDRQRLYLSGGRFHQYLPPDRNLEDWSWFESRQLALEYAYEGDRWSGGGAGFLKTDVLAGHPTRLNGGELWGRFQAGGFDARLAANTFGQLRGRLRYEFGLGWTTGLAYTAWQQTERDYHRVDVSLNKLFLVGDRMLIVYATINNLADRDNVGFSRRLVFFGGVLQY